MSILTTLAAVNQFFPVREAAKQLFTRPKTGLKEIAITGVTAAIVSIYNTVQISCSTQCDFLLVSGEQWGALSFAAVIMYAHLRSKALKVAE